MLFLRYLHVKLREKNNMNFKKLVIPDSFEEKLPELKQKTLKWTTVLNSGSKINSIANISFFQPNCQKPVGSFILVPALATNSKIDPLITAITYWALTHKYNVVNIDTFLGDFNSNIEQNTYPEFKTILTESIKFVQPHISNTYSIIIGHCVSATGITDVFNEEIKNGESLPVQAALFFAPWPVIPQMKYDALMNRCKYMESKGIDVFKLDIETQLKVAHMKFVCAMKDFTKEAENSQYEPEIMAQWQIPITFVVAGRDEISPHARAKEKFAQLKQLVPNTNKLSYLYLPERKHSFEKLYTDSKAIIDLIKTQRQKHL